MIVNNRIKATNCVKVQQINKPILFCTDEFRETAKSSFFQRWILRRRHQSPSARPNVRHLDIVDQLSKKHSQNCHVILVSGNDTSRNKSKDNGDRPSIFWKNAQSEFYWESEGRRGCVATWLGRVPAFQRTHASTAFNRKSHHSWHQTA